MIGLPFAESVMSCIKPTLSSEGRYRYIKALLGGGLSACVRGLLGENAQLAMDKRAQRTLHAINMLRCAFHQQDQNSLRLEDGILSSTPDLKFWPLSFLLPERSSVPESWCIKP